MSAEGSAYLDSSALVKLVLLEAESGALLAHLKRWPTRTSCALALVEVIRAVRPEGVHVVERAQRLLETLQLVAVDDDLLRAAARLNPPLRSLDAIHVAAAQSLEHELEELITYDLRMTDAANALGLPVAAPT